MTPERLAGLRHHIKLHKEQIPAHCCSLCAVVEELIEEIERLQKVRLAAQRVCFGNYPPWASSGGTNECDHGVAEGIACMDCDERLIAE